jgi:hypothetical protein
MDQPAREATINSSLRTLLVSVGLISSGFALTMVLCEAALQVHYRVMKGELSGFRGRRAFQRAGKQKFAGLLSN